MKITRVRVRVRARVRVLLAYLFLGGEPADAEPDGAVGHADESWLHIAGLEGGGGAGRAKGQGHVLQGHQGGGKGKSRDLTIDMDSFRAHNREI